jgi:phage tail-like protein
MNEDTRKNFLHLNRDGEWAGFHRHGLELRRDGSLQLASLPLLEGETPEDVAALGEPDGPAGIAVDVEGTVYFSDPSGHRVWKIDGCDGSVTVVACIGGEGGDPAQFKKPRGLLIPRRRRALMVADSGNHRVQIFDPSSWQLVDVWAEAPGRHRSLSCTPLALADDDEGNVYVVDSGRVQKFNLAGDLVECFWDRMRATGAPANPKGVAVHGQGGETLIYVIDEASHSIMVFKADGAAAVDPEGDPISFGSERLQNPMGIAVTEDSVYVGDNARRAVFRFRREEGYEFVGEAVGYRGPVAALAVDNEGDLLVHSGANLTPPCSVPHGFSASGDLLVHTGANLIPVKLRTGRGYRERGVLWNEEPLQAKSVETNWLRLRSRLESLAAGAHLRLFAHTSNDSSQAPDVDPESDDPFADGRWRPRSGAPDPFGGVSDIFIGGEPARYLWVGALFSSEGLATPVLSQLRVEYDHEAYLGNLPAIYRNGSCGNFLIRFLALFETFFNDVEGKIDNLSALFDAEAVPKDFLPWLAGWFALDLDDEWDEEKRRRIIASAFEMYGRRGTVAGLREALRVFAGLTAIIDEPLAQSSWWGLPFADSPCGCHSAGSGGDLVKRGACEGGCGCGQSGSSGAEKSLKAVENSILGVTTMLAPAHAQGAVVGSTATLDHSHLITGERFGAPLFEEVAHRFIVRVYRGQLRCAETETLARAVIEREKPAHTVYHLCVIEPKMRVGFQARVGIDAVVAGPVRPSRLDGEARLGKETALGGPAAGRIGERSRVGISARVG